MYTSRERVGLVDDKLGGSGVWGLGSEIWVWGLGSRAWGREREREEGEGEGEWWWWWGGGGRNLLATRMEVDGNGLAVLLGRLCRILVRPIPLFREFERFVSRN